MRMCIHTHARPPSRRSCPLASTPCPGVSRGSHTSRAVRTAASPPRARRTSRRPPPVERKCTGRRIRGIGARAHPSDGSTAPAPAGCSPTRRATRACANAPLAAGRPWQRRRRQSRLLSPRCCQSPARSRPHCPALRRCCRRPPPGSRVPVRAASSARQPAAWQRPTPHPLPGTPTGCSPPPGRATQLTGPTRPPSARASAGPERPRNPSGTPGRPTPSQTRGPAPAPPPALLAPPVPRPVPPSARPPAPTPRRPETRPRRPRSACQPKRHRLLRAHLALQGQRALARGIQGRLAPPAPDPAAIRSSSALPGLIKFGLSRPAADPDPLVTCSMVVAWHETTESSCSFCLRYETSCSRNRASRAAASRATTSADSFPPAAIAGTGTPFATTPPATPSLPAACCCCDLRRTRRYETQRSAARRPRCSAPIKAGRPLAGTLAAEANAPAAEPSPLPPAPSPPPAPLKPQPPPIGSPPTTRRLDIAAAAASASSTRRSHAPPSRTAASARSARSRRASA
eukprot:scaffold4238_cov105-Isochrysis_galbana.AAC.7